MKRPTMRQLGVALVVVLLLAPLFPGAPRLFAQEPDSYRIDWWRLDAGGIMRENAQGQYRLSGSFAQADAGVLTGSGFALHGGFWSVAMPSEFVCLPLVLRHAP